MPDTRLWSSVNQTCDALESTCSSYTVLIKFTGSKNAFCLGWCTSQSFKVMGSLQKKDMEIEIGD